MTLTYTVETLSQAWAEMTPYFEAHWREVSDHQRYGIPAVADVAAYQALEDAGALHLVAVRDAGVLVGYATYLLQSHLHYKDVLHAFGTDLYYLAPAYRKGLAGYRLFQVLEQTLRARGCGYVVHRTKSWKDMSRLFERLGYRELERAYGKALTARATGDDDFPWDAGGEDAARARGTAAASAKET